MASALAHPLYRTPGIDQVMHQTTASLNEHDLGQYHGPGPDSRIPSPLPPRPMFLKDMSRSSSASTQSSGTMLFQPPNFHTRTASLSIGRAEEYHRQQQGRTSLPGLNTLASLASTTEPHTRLFSVAAAPGISYTHMPPVPTPSISGNNNIPAADAPRNCRCTCPYCDKTVDSPVCQNCETSTTPLWRRDESGSVLCNACGLFLKLHGRPRPISLKTDVIKSRNRVKTANQGPKKQSLPASQSIDVLQNGAHRRVSQMTAQVHPQRSQSPISRTGTPSTHHDPNIAPQHMFDGVSLQDHAFQTPALPNLGGQPSPGSIASLNDRQLEPPMTYEQLLAQNTILKTRVSELEVINMMYSDNENSLRKERDDAIKSQNDLKRRVEELEKQINLSELDHPHKKARVDFPPPE